jgi:hypothetical protein
MHRTVGRFRLGDGDVLTPRLDLHPFVVVRTGATSASIGSALHPLSPSDSYEVRVRSCSDVGCGRASATTIEPVTRPSTRIGEFALDRIQRPVPAPGTFTLDLRGTLRVGERRLGAITVVLRGRDGVLTRIAYDHVSGRVTARGGKGAPDLRGSRAVVGRDGQVRLRLALALPRQLAGSQLGVEVSATDRRGQRQASTPAGALLVR